MEAWARLSNRFRGAKTTCRSARKRGWGAAKTVGPAEPICNGFSGSGQTPKSVSRHWLCAPQVFEDRRFRFRPRSSPVSAGTRRRLRLEATGSLRFGQNIGLTSSKRPYFSGQLVGKRVLLRGVRVPLPRRSEESRSKVNPFQHFALLTKQVRFPRPAPPCYCCLRRGQAFQVTPPFQFSTKGVHDLPLEHCHLRWSFKTKRKTSTGTPPSRRGS